MLVDKAKWEAAFRGYHAVFQEVLAQPSYWKIIANEIVSTGASETYNWLGAPPKLKEWVSDREHARLRMLGTEVVNKDFATGIELSQNDIDDDRIGILTPRVRMLADSVARHFDELVFALFNAGFTSLCYDGQFFFDQDHNDAGGPVQSNVGSAALSGTSFDTAIAQMMSVRDEEGRPLGVRPTHLIVPPALRATARGIIEVEQLASGASNPNFHAVDLITTPLISSPTAWFLIDASRSLKPVILQMRRPPQIIQEQDVDENMYMRRIRRIGVDWRGAAAYGLWQFAYGSTGA